MQPFVTGRSVSVLFPKYEMIDAKAFRDRLYLKGTSAQGARKAAESETTLARQRSIYSEMLVRQLDWPSRKPQMQL